MKYDDNGDDDNDSNDSENHDYENIQIDSSIASSMKEVVNNFFRRIYCMIIIFTYFLFPLKFNLLLIILL